MSTTRLHDKFHRQNHHTYSSTINPDAGHDPIASPAKPFRGDFNLSGALSASCPLSAVAGVFRATAGVMAAGLSGVSAFSTAPSIYDLADVSNKAGLYCYGAAPNLGPFNSINFVRGFVPKALIVDGYADFRFPMYAQSIYTPYLQATMLSATSVYTPFLSAVGAKFTTLSATTLNVTTINYTTTASATTTAVTFSANDISTPTLNTSALKVPGRGAVAYRLTPSSTIPQSTWTLVPLTSAKWNPYNWYTIFGTVSADKQGICLCEFTAVARPVSGSPLGIVASVTTNTGFGAADPDTLGVGFAGTEYFKNNGVTYSTTAGVSGVTFQGTTLVAVNGTGEQIGCYFFNSNGQTIVDYCRLRVVHLSFTT